MTDLIRTALEWVRAALLGRRTTGTHSRPTTPRAAPATPTPDVLGARLVTVRGVRPASPRPRDWEAEEAWEHPGAMVRPYVAHLDATPRYGKSPAWDGGWGRIG
jgi:hypothetical protein